MSPEDAVALPRDEWIRIPPRMRDQGERFQRRLRLAWRWLALPVTLAWLCACGTDTPLLNSDRIEQRYGSYGVEIVGSDAQGRRSNLYSVHDGRRICRTYAVVRFQPAALANDDPALREAHAKILEGGSIGATLRHAGFAVHKAPRVAGALPAPATEPGWLSLMGVTTAAGLAVQEYRLSINNALLNIEYADIIEVYHPDFLGPSDLRRMTPGRAVAIPADVLRALGVRPAP